MNGFERPASETPEAAGREKVLAAAEFIVKQEEERLESRSKTFSRISAGAFAATLGIGGVALAKALGAELPMQGQETFAVAMAGQALMWGSKLLSDQSRSKLEAFVGTYGGHRILRDPARGGGFRE